MIHHNNSLLEQKAINATMYLVNPKKDDQYFRVKLKKMHSFGKGQYVINKRRDCIV